jgi:hypothetical protein
VARLNQCPSFIFENSLPFGQQLFKQTNLILFSRTLAKAINRSHRQEIEGDGDASLGSKGTHLRRTVEVFGQYLFIDDSVNLRDRYAGCDRGFTRRQAFHESCHTHLRHDRFNCSDASEQLFAQGEVESGPGCLGE